MPTENRQFPYSSVGKGVEEEVPSSRRGTEGNWGREPSQILSQKVYLPPESHSQKGLLPPESHSGKVI